MSYNEINGYGMLVQQLLFDYLGGNLKKRLQREMDWSQRHCAILSKAKDMAMQF